MSKLNLWVLSLLYSVAFVQPVLSMEREEFGLEGLAARPQQSFYLQQQQPEERFKIRVSCEVGIKNDRSFCDFFQTIKEDIVVWDLSNNRIIGKLGEQNEDRISVNEKYSSNLPLIYIALRLKDEEEICKTMANNEIIDLEKVVGVRISLLPTLAKDRTIPRAVTTFRKPTNEDPCIYPNFNNQFLIVFAKGPQWTCDRDIIQQMKKEGFGVKQNLRYGPEKAIDFMEDTPELKGYNFAMEYIRRVREKHNLKVEDMRNEESLKSLIGLFISEHILKRGEETEFLEQLGM